MVPGVAYLITFGVWTYKTYFTYDIKYFMLDENSNLIFRHHEWVRWKRIMKRQNSRILRGTIKISSLTFTTGLKVCDYFLERWTTTPQIFWVEVFNIKWSLILALLSWNLSKRIIQKNQTQKVQVQSWSKHNWNNHPSLFPETISRFIYYTTLLSTYACTRNCR